MRVFSMIKSMFLAGVAAVMVIQAAAAETVQVEIPDWIANTKIYGDIRLRQQWDMVDGKDDRSRQRIRFRINGENEIGDRLKIGYGLATGGTDPRSTNQTLDNNFETPDIRLNNAYVEFAVLDSLRMWGGKYSGIKHAIWRPTDMLWDSDITPEGAGLRYKSDHVFANAGYLIVDENKNGSDPGMGYAQAGGIIKLSDSVKLKAASIWYIPSSVQGSVMDHSAGSNSTNEFGGLLYDFNVVEGSLELSAADFITLDKAALIADYAVNTDPDDDNIAWDAGFKFKKSFVSFKYNYRYIENDAFVDAYPDSDAYGGATGVKGHEAEVKFAVYENTSFNIDAYHLTEIDGNRDHDVIQFDLVVKF